MSSELKDFESLDHWSEFRRQAESALSMFELHAFNSTEFILAHSRYAVVIDTEISFRFPAVSIAFSLSSISLAFW
jgi:hypothetical protein